MHIKYEGGLSLMYVTNYWIETKHIEHAALLQPDYTSLH